MRWEIGVLNKCVHTQTYNYHIISYYRKNNEWALEWKFICVSNLISLNYQIGTYKWNKITKTDMRIKHVDW